MFLPKTRRKTGKCGQDRQGVRTETPVKCSSAHTSWNESSACQTSRSLFRTPLAVFACEYDILACLCMGITSLVDCSQPAILSACVLRASIHHMSATFPWEINDKPRVIGRNSMGKRLALISRNRVHIHEILLGYQTNKESIRR